MDMDMDCEMQDAAVAENEPARPHDEQPTGFQDGKLAESQGFVSMDHNEGDDMYMGDNEQASSF